jgi:murein DD-endopeptidase MepM/ murein hydrolase activator NlpD
VSKPIYVLNDDENYFSIDYEDNGDPNRQTNLEALWKSFNRTDPATRKSIKVYVRPSTPEIAVRVNHLMPPGLKKRRYRIETFIPGIHATSKMAIFLIVNNIQATEDGARHLEQTLSMVNMSELFDVWFTLGIYELDPQKGPEIGQVTQYDFTFEEPPTEISFGPVRWVPIIAPPSAAYKFDSPVGTDRERKGPIPSGRIMFGRYPVWDGEWFDANPFLNWYTYGHHTGADLNLPGSSGADKGKPIFVIADGVVTYAGKAGSWGNIIVVEHPQALVTYHDGSTGRQRVYSRYGHVDDNILVRAGQTISRGDNIGFIGLARGAISGWHLHFDVSYTDVLKKRPAYWPSLTTYRSVRGGNPNAVEAAKNANKREVLRHFIDPLRFIQDNHG